MSRKRKTYSLEFKQEAVKLVTEKGMSLNGTSQSVGVCKSGIPGVVTGRLRGGQLQAGHPEGGHRRLLFTSGPGSGYVAANAGGRW